MSFWAPIRSFKLAALSPVTSICGELHTLHMAYLSLLPNRFVRPVDGDVSITVRRCDARGDDGGLRYKARDRGR